jgi:peptidyl-prolyl cis-trans isomerase SurA
MKRLIPLIAVILVISIQLSGASELVEKIYAVINGELITYSELKNAEIEMSRLLTQQFKGEELTKEINNMKATLLDRLIEQKVILSYARDENYDVEGHIEMVIKKIKADNNIKSDEELQKAIASQGIDYQEWKKQLKENRIQQRYIYQEIGSKIKIDNSAIMAFYKDNIKEYTIPPKLSLNCIFLDKTNYSIPGSLKEKQDSIDQELKQAKFIDVAKKYSELPGTDNNYFLGEFNKGELDAKIEAASTGLKKDEYSKWIETETGYYITELIEYVEAQLVEYQKVRNEIENKLFNKEQDIKLKTFLEKLKQESHIKIYEKNLASNTSIPVQK